MKETIKLWPEINETVYKCIKKSKQKGQSLVFESDELVERLIKINRKSTSLNQEGKIGILIQMS